MRRSCRLDHLVPFFKRCVANDFFRIVFSNESLSAVAFQIGDTQLGTSVSRRAVGKGRFASGLDLFTPAVDQAACEPMFPAELGRRALARFDLADDLLLEFAAVISSCIPTPSSYGQRTC